MLTQQGEPLAPSGPDVHHSAGADQPIDIGQVRREPPGDLGF
jgi:hypothetical protein